MDNTNLTLDKTNPHDSEDTEYQCSLYMKGHGGIYGCIFMVPNTAGGHKTLYSYRTIEIAGNPIQVMLESSWPTVLGIGVIALVIAVVAIISIAIGVCYKRKNEQLQKRIIELTERCKRV